MVKLLLLFKPLPCKREAEPKTASAGQEKEENAKTMNLCGENVHALTQYVPFEEEIEHTSMGLTILDLN